MTIIAILLLFIGMNLDIIFRNIKPEDILFATDGYLKLTDFGFAKVTQDRTYTLCGTPEVKCSLFVLNILLIAFCLAVPSARDCHWNGSSQGRRLLGIR